MMLHCYCLFALFLFMLRQTTGSPKCDECKLEPLGCFSDVHNKRALTEEILNERDPTSKVYNGQMIKWDDYQNWLNGFACRCARKAQEKGYTVIGLQFFGECWSGPTAHKTYSVYGNSHECINGKLDKLTGTTSCEKYVGRGLTNYVYKIGVKGCPNLKFEPVGCFHDNINKRFLPHYITNERDPSHNKWNGHLIEWGKWNDFNPQMICRCAEVARKRGDDYFAIQFWGECWSGKTSEVNIGNMIYSDTCRNENFKPCKCDSYSCVGMKETNYVYKFADSCQ